MKIDTNNQNIIKLFNRESKEIVKSSAFLNPVGQLLVSRAKQNLEDGAADGKSYELLKPATKKQKQRKGFSAKPLQRTGLMKRSLNHEISGGLKLKGLEIIKHHHFGAPKANIPQREVFTIDSEDFLDIKDILVRQIKNKIK